MQKSLEFLENTINKDALEAGDRIRAAVLTFERLLETGSTNRLKIAEILMDIEIFIQNLLASKF